MIFYQAAVLVLLLVCFASLSWNLARFRKLRKAHYGSPSWKRAFPGEESTLPFVSILVPARNEAHRIGPCAGSLAAQDYPNYEVLVLDDNSEDGTADVLRGLGFSDEPGARLRILHGAPLPGGWTGKGWACHQLAGAARGEWILFVDADTTHETAMLASTLIMAWQTRADLFSAWPRLLAFTWSEKIVLPMIHLALAFYPHALLQWLQANPHRASRLSVKTCRSFGAANGQFLFFRKAVYDQIGGHAAVSGHLVEDVALGRAVAARTAQGLRLINCDGSDLTSVRMYERFSEVWEGFTKNIRAVFEDELSSYLLTGLTMTLLFLAPFAIVWITSGTARYLAAAQIALIYLIRARLTWRFGTSWLGCLLHPVGQALGTAIGLNSWRRSAGKGVTWKGRLYEVNHHPELRS